MLILLTFFLKFVFLLLLFFAGRGFTLYGNSFQESCLCLLFFRPVSSRGLSRLVTFSFISAGIHVWEMTCGFLRGVLTSMVSVSTWIAGVWRTENGVSLLLLLPDSSSAGGSLSSKTGEEAGRTLRPRRSSGRGSGSRFAAQDSHLVSFCPSISLCS